MRKRVIRIMREICERQPGFDMIPQMLARIVRRVTDEEGVKKLTLDTLQSLLFQPSRERDSVTLITKVAFSNFANLHFRGYSCEDLPLTMAELLRFLPLKSIDSLLKVMTLTDMVQVCVKENTVDFVEQMLSCLMKSGDRTLQLASRQIVDALVDNVLTLDSKMASSGLFCYTFSIFSEFN